MDRPVRQGGERLGFGYGVGGHQRTVVVVEIDLLGGDRAAAPAARLDGPDGLRHLGGLIRGCQPVLFPDSRRYIPVMGIVCRNNCHQ